MAIRKLKSMVFIAGMAVMLAGCDNAANVNIAIKRNADYFKASRKITVVNTRLDKVVYENEGLLSFEVSENGRRLDVIEKESDDIYRKDIIVMNNDTMYLVEDLEGIKIE